MFRITAAEMQVIYATITLDGHLRPDPVTLRKYYIIGSSSSFQVLHSNINLLDHVKVLCPKHQNAMVHLHQDTDILFKH